jgi:protein O-mannosyl-transferase
MIPTTYRKFLLFILLAFACSIIYSPGIYGPFIFDDLSNITGNSFLQLQNLNFSSLYSSSSAGHAGPLQRPVAMLSFALNYYFANGYVAPAFKITNIVIHLINAAFVFILCQQLFQRRSIIANRTADNNLAFWFAGSISLLWALHPINLTSVLYIVQRMTSLSTLFSLGCIISYLAARNQWLSHAFSWRVVGLFFISFTSLLLALFSKENAVLTPLIILLIELVLFQREKPWLLFKSLSPANKRLIYVSLFAFCLFALLWAIDYAAGGFNSRPFTMMERVLTESRVLCFYISLILIPRINGFGLFHDDIALSTSLFAPWTTITSIIFIISLLVIAFYYRKNKPLFSLGIGWFFIGHLLESTFFPLEIAHEHRNNLPSIGLILAAVSLIPIASLSSKKVISGITAVALILGSTTWLRAQQWGNYQTLAYYEAAHHPSSPAIQALLSNAANQTGDIDVATQAIKKAMELEPKETAYAMHYQNILAVHGRDIPDELQQQTIKRIKRNLATPSTILALQQIASCLDKAPCHPLKDNYMAWLNTFINNEPKNSTYYYFRGKANRAIGRSLSALNDFQRAHELRKDFLHPLFEMLAILLKHNQINQAEFVLQQLKTANKQSKNPRNTEIDRLEKNLSDLKASNARLMESDTTLP